MKKRKISESEIQSQIIDFLSYRVDLFFQRTNNIPVYDEKQTKYRSMPKGAKSGFPDIIVIKNGVFIGLEVKTLTGKQSKKQKDMEKEIIKNGGQYHIVRCLHDVIKVIDNK